MKKWFGMFIVLMIAAMFYAGTAIANGTITATFLYNGSGVDQPLDNAYVYLQDATNIDPIMEKYFRNAEYILGPSDANGNIYVSVPEGTYRIRITRRAPLASAPTLPQAYGAPRPGDYTWHLAGNSPSITVTTGSVINLGAIYAHPFSQSITITGTITGETSGAPLAGWFVKATAEPCTDNHGTSNQCGATVYAATLGAHANTVYSPQYPAELLTNSNGNYTIDLPGAGTYYVYACPSPAGCVGSLGGVYREFPGGYITCNAAHVAEYRNHLYYAVCPLAINGPTAGVNVAVPGY